MNAGYRRQIAELEAERTDIIAAAKRMAEKCRLQNNEQIGCIRGAIGAIGMIESEYLDLLDRYLQNTRTSAADYHRLRVAGERVGLPFGCDTAEHMADEILALRDNLATAQEDTARLDWWIQKSAHSIMQREDGKYAVYCAQRVTAWFDTPRAAIDAARVRG